MGGATIDVATVPGADAGAVELFLNGSARAALIHQRGELPLHAATLLPPAGGGAVAISGTSGIGKSKFARIKPPWLAVDRRRHYKSHIR